MRIYRTDQLGFSKICPNNFFYRQEYHCFQTDRVIVHQNAAAHLFNKVFDDVQFQAEALKHILSKQ